MSPDQVPDHRYHGACVGISKDRANELESYVSVCTHCMASVLLLHGLQGCVYTYAAIRAQVCPRCIESGEKESKGGMEIV